MDDREQAVDGGDLARIATVDLKLSLLAYLLVDDLPSTRVHLSHVVVRPRINPGSSYTMAPEVISTR